MRSLNPDPDHLSEGVAVAMMANSAPSLRKSLAPIASSSVVPPVAWPQHACGLYVQWRAGGMARCPGFKDRLEAELRPLVPEQFPLTITEAQDPITAAWYGGVLFARSPAFRNHAITKHEYEEQGSRRLHYHAVPA